MDGARCCLVAAVRATCAAENNGPPWDRSSLAERRAAGGPRAAASTSAAKKRNEICFRSESHGQLDQNQVQSTRKRRARGPLASWRFRATYRPITADLLFYCISHAVDQFDADRRQTETTEVSHISLIWVGRCQSCYRGDKTGLFSTQSLWIMCWGDKTEVLCEKCFYQY